MKTKPSRDAIAKLRSQPHLAGDFNRKYGDGAAQSHLGNGAVIDLFEELIRATQKTNALLEEMLDCVSAPKRVIFDQDGNIIGAMAMQNDELRDTYEEILGEQEDEQMRRRKERGA